MPSEHQRLVNAFPEGRVTLFTAASGLTNILGRLRTMLVKFESISESAESPMFSALLRGAQSAEEELLSLSEALRVAGAEEADRSVKLADISAVSASPAAGVDIDATPTRSALSVHDVSGATSIGQSVLSPKKKKRVHFQEEFLRELEGRQIDGILNTRRKRKAALQVDVAWATERNSKGDSVAPIITWLDSTFDSPCVRDGLPSRAESSFGVEDLFEVSLGASPRHEGRDHYISELGMDTDEAGLEENTTKGGCSYDGGVLWDHDDRAEAALESILEVDLIECAGGVSHVANFILRGLQMIFRHVDGSSVTTFTEQWTRLFVPLDDSVKHSIEAKQRRKSITRRRSTSTGGESGGAGLQSSDGVIKPPYVGLARALGVFRCVLVQLCRTRATHSLLFSQFTRGELLSVLVAALTTGAADTGLPNPEISKNQHMLRLFVDDERTPQESLAAFVTLAHLHQPECDFVGRLLAEAVAGSSVESADGAPAARSMDQATAAAQAAIQKFDVEVKDLVRLAAPAQHGALVRALNALSLASDVKSSVAPFRRGFLASVLHLSVVGFHFLLSPELSSQWTTRWIVAGGHLPHHADLAQREAFGKQFVSTAAHALHATSAAKSAVEHVLLPMVKLISQRYFWDVVVRDSVVGGTEEEGTGEGRDASLEVLFPRQWCANLAESAGMFDNFTEKQALGRVGDAVRIMRQSRVSEHVRPNMQLLALLMLNTTQDTATMVRSYVEMVSKIASVQHIEDHRALAVVQSPTPSDSAVTSPITSARGLDGGADETPVRLPMDPPDVKTVQDAPQAYMYAHVHYVATRFAAQELALLLGNQTSASVSWVEDHGKKLASRWTTMLVDLQEEVHRRCLQQTIPLTATPVLIAHPTLLHGGAHTTNSANIAALREEFTDTARAFRWLFRLTHAPPPHPQNTETFFMDVVIFSLTQTLGRALEALFVSAARAAHDTGEKRVATWREETRISEVEKTYGRSRATDEARANVIAATAGGGGAGVGVPPDSAGVGGRTSSQQQGTSAMMDRFSAFQNRLDRDATTRVSWSRAKGHLFRHRQGGALGN